METVDTHLTAEEILELAILKAHRNGWLRGKGVRFVAAWIEGDAWMLELSVNSRQRTVAAWDILLRQDFCVALFGDTPRHKVQLDDIVMHGLPHWRYCRLVLADEMHPIMSLKQYL